jgi:NAD(P)-dependent dehydrogenase (short-subunit alcohol dehydrogenase family)
LANYGANVAVVDIVAEQAGQAAADQIESVNGVESIYIRVNAISPQVVETGMTKGRLSKKGEYEKSVSQIPLGRLLQPDDLQGAAVFLASDASDMVTGHILHVDGGYLAK